MIRSVCHAVIAAVLLIGPVAPVALAGEAAAPRPVVTEIVTADPTRQREFPGVVEAAHETELAFQTIGRLAELNVQPGDTVKKGDVLASLDRVSLQEDVDAAQAALSSARAEADYAERTYKRVKTLADRNIAARADLEEAEANRNSAHANALAAEADLAAAQEALSYGVLKAPEDGIVLETPIKAGTVVSSGTTVVTLAGMTGREAVIDVPKEFMKVLPPDAVFNLARHEGSPTVSRARLKVVEPVADDTLRGRRLRLTIADDGAFRIGSLVSATYADNGQDIMTLPEAAIFGGADDPSVWRVSGNPRRVSKVSVKLGPTLGQRVEITQGLDVGDEIVIRGIHSLTDGEAVGARYILPTGGLGNSGAIEGGIDTELGQTDLESQQ